MVTAIADKKNKTAGSGKRQPKSSPPGFSWALPKELGIEPDPLRARIDIHNEACTLTLFDVAKAETRIVSITEVSHALAKELAMSSGLLPPNALWWRNTPKGALTAFYAEPKVRRLTLSQGPSKLKRYDLPMPGLVFVCLSGNAPWVCAVKSRPTKPTDEVFAAPLANVYDDGRTCPGSNKYPARVEDIPQSFFTSFFSRGANLNNRSKKYPDDILKLWEFLNKKKEYPLDDLVKIGTVKDLLEARLK